MKKALFPVLVILALLSSACTKQSGAASGKVTLELFSTKPENQTTYQGLISAFHAENPDITINLSSPPEAGTVLRSRLTKNDIPDLIALGGDATYRELSSAGVLLDLSGQSFLDRINGSYQQMLYDLHADKSKTPYGVPYAANGSGILYNKDIFSQYNVALPETWDALLITAKAFKAAGVNPFLLTFANNWTTLPPWNSMAPVLAPADFGLDRAKGTTSFAGTHEKVLEQYIQILDLCGNDFMGTSYDDGNKAFAEGKAAMMINGNWSIAEFLKTNPGMKVDMLTFPSSNDKSKNTITSGVDVAFTVSAATKNKDAALKFIEFMTRPEISQRYIDEQFAFSAVKGVDQNNPTVQGVKETIAEGRVSDFVDHLYPAGFDLASILSAFALNYTNRMDNTQNIRETLQNCDTEYNALQ
ncbi:ABC transporter substrate-binding protein [Treponema primitia]|uniref:ABC transporter substrate-binding protein n=1 Tax=Treponema primitia TaxID=88058 RepID=UPI0002555069|nr:extracellular solute-binding protein [Treponema primitia]